MRKTFAKHQEATGKTVASTLAVLNTARAIERKGIADAHKLVGAAVEEREGAVERKNEVEKKLLENEQILTKSEASVNLARYLAREKDVELQQQTELRKDAERLRQEGSGRRSGRWLSWKRGTAG